MDIQVKKKLLWATFISSILMAFLLLKVDWEHFTLIADKMDLKYLLASCSVYLFGNLVRTFRFIQLDHTDKKLSDWWNINALYNFITSTLPGGTGEAATAYVLKRFSMFNILGSLRILLISRLMDVSALSAFFFLASIYIGSSTPYRETAIWLSGGLFLMSSIALVPASERFILGLLQRLPGNITSVRKVCEKLNELLEITKERRGVAFYIFTLIQSLLVAISGVVMLHLLLRSFGIEFTYIECAYCYGVYAVFQIIPLQGIAGIGTQAAWWALALNVAGYKAPDAIAMGFVLYGILYLFVVLMGLISFLVWLKGRKNG